MVGSIFVFGAGNVLVLIVGAELWGWNSEI